MANIIWLHEDALRATHPIFEIAPSNAEAVFIWDDQYLQSMDYGFKRLTFIYEALQELPVTIHRGDSTETLTELAAGSTIYALTTPNPKLLAIMDNLAATNTVERVPDTAFVDCPSPPSLKRFFPYWNKAKRRLL